VYRRITKNNKVDSLNFLRKYFNFIKFFFILKFKVSNYFKKVEEKLKTLNISKSLSMLFLLKKKELNLFFSKIFF
jgi:hypothetical protein